MVGKVGGRGLPLVAADLLKFKLGARLYAGSPGQLTISEPPPQPEAKPDPLRLLAQEGGRQGGQRGEGGAASGSQALPAPQLVRQGPPVQGRRRQPAQDQNGNREAPGHRGAGSWPCPPWERWRCWPWCCCPLALADDPDDDDRKRKPYGDAWRLDEIYFVPPDPVPGRRIFIERLSVSGNHANVTLRAAHELHLRGRAYGGRSGRTLRMGFNTPMSAGQSKSYNLSLDGPSPSFTFSWVDALGRSGAVSLKSNQIPYPLPSADGELCDLAMTSLEWAPGSITGVIASECIADTRQEVDLPVYGGHFSQSVPALLDATVTGITGTVSVSAGSNATTALPSSRAARPGSPCPYPTRRLLTSWRSRRSLRRR